MGKKVLFIHYRVGERDGVSLEITKRIALIEKLGHTVYLLSGYDNAQNENSFIIPEIDLKQKENQFLLENFFGEATLTEDEAIKEYTKQEQIIQKKLEGVLKKIKPNVIFCHNILAYARNLPATTALIKALDNLQIPTVAINHDFWFERPKFQKSNYDFINKILSTLPPKKDYILKQQVINSLAADELVKRRSIYAEQIGDYFDYTKPTPEKDAYNADLLSSLQINPHDVLVVHATRIIERKAIENAMLFVKKLQETIRSRKILSFGSKRLQPNSNVYLLFPNFVEVDGQKYFEKLCDLAKQLGIHVIWGEDMFLPERKEIHGEKKYNFWDAYVYADFITYTSIKEGFGNQLLEAFYFRKVPVVFEYDVFIKDIKPEGYTYISLGNTYENHEGYHFVSEEKISYAVKELIDVFADEKNVTKITDHNFMLAKQYHDESLLQKNLASTLNSL